MTRPPRYGPASFILVATAHARATADLLERIVPNGDTERDLVERLVKLYRGNHVLVDLPPDPESSSG